MSKRVIRHTPLLTKLTSVPFDLYLYLNELHSSIEWDDFSVSVALPLGIGLTIITIICQGLNNYYNSINVKSNNALFDTDYYNYERIKRSLSYNEQLQQQSSHGQIVPSILWLLNGISSLIVIFGLFNTYQIITSYKNYKLLNASSKPSSPSAFKGSLNHSNSIIVKSINYLLSAIFGKPEIDEDEDESQLIDDTIDIEDEEVWQLNIWDPSKFQLHLLIGLNPVNLFIIHFINNQSNLLNYVGTLGLVSITISIMINKFTLLVKDKQILYEAMFKEYNTKFVNPKVNKVKKDVVIDACRGPYYGDDVLTKYADTKSRIFITHDINGNEIDNKSDTSIEELPTSHYGDPQYSRVSSRVSSRRHSLYEDADSNDTVRWYNNSSTPYQPGHSRVIQTPTYNRSSSVIRSSLNTHNKENRVPPPPPNLSYIRSPTKLSPTKEPLSYRSFSRSPSRSPTRDPISFRSPSRSPTRIRSPSPTKGRNPNLSYTSSPIRGGTTYVKNVPPQSPTHHPGWR
ncbi:uncharacterized protein RJT21DRAFT_28690 [Scheffersomyces amazonensis]|uniref:uncharacterized protein n=1 Tax=Scheffersomyces amazonensis TaxID=1078765 RepID=UPI00315DB066